MNVLTMKTIIAEFIAIICAVSFNICTETPTDYGRLICHKSYVMSAIPMEYEDEESSALCSSIGMEETEEEPAGEPDKVLVEESAEGSAEEPVKENIEESIEENMEESSVDEHVDDESVNVHSTDEHDSDTEGVEDADPTRDAITTGGIGSDFAVDDESPDIIADISKYRTGVEGSSDGGEQQ